MSTRRPIVPLLLLTCLAAPLVAQQAEINLAAAQARAELNDQDRAQIRAFVTQRLATIVANDKLDARRAVDELQAAHTGTDGFKREYAAISIELLGPAIRRAELVPATRLVTVLNTLDAVAAHPVLLQTLRDERVGVRAAAAIGLRLLRAKLAAAGGDTYRNVLSALAEAGKREKSRETLRAIYAALDYAVLPSPPEAKPNLTALLDLLDARARLAASGDLPAAGADDAGLRLAASLARSMDEGERRRLTIAVATLVKHAIEQYVGGPRLYKARDESAGREALAIRDGAERLIIVGEQLLTSLLSPEAAPKVSDEMMRLDAPNMKVQWQRWNELLRQRVNQEFTLSVTPETEDEDSREDGSESK